MTESEENLFAIMMAKKFGYDLIGHKDDGTADLIKNEDIK